MDTPNNFKVTNVNSGDIDTVSTKEFREKIAQCGDNYNEIMCCFMDVYPAIEQLMIPLPKEIFFSCIATLIDFYSHYHNMSMEEGNEILQNLIDYRHVVNEMFPLN